MLRFIRQPRPSSSSENTREEQRNAHESKEQEQEQNMNESQEEEESFRYPTQEDYNMFRNANRRNDYVPINKIGYVFSHHFTNSTIIHNVDENIKICNIKISSLLDAHVRNWEHNREPDVVRIPEIARYIYESRTRIHTMFYLNYNFKQDRFEIIDGSHRYWALKMIKSLSDENGIIIDDRLKGEDGQNTTTWFNPDENIDWLLNIDIIVQINFTSTKNDLITLRNDINNSQPMPIETRDDYQDVEKNGIINSIADEYIRRYKKCFGSSKGDAYLRNHRKTSRDKFIVLLSNLYDKYNININRVGALKLRLEIANDKIRIELEENKIRCNENIKNRCHETGCYLFLYKDCDLEELI